MQVCFRPPALFAQLLHPAHLTPLHTEARLLLERSGLLMQALVGPPAAAGPQQQSRWQGSGETSAGAPAVSLR